MRRRPETDGERVRLVRPRRHVLNPDGRALHVLDALEPDDVRLERRVVQRMRRERREPPRDEREERREHDDDRRRDRATSAESGRRSRRAARSSPSRRPPPARASTTARPASATTSNGPSPQWCCHHRSTRLNGSPTNQSVTSSTIPAMIAAARSGRAPSSGRCAEAAARGRRAPPPARSGPRRRAPCSSAIEVTRARRVRAPRSTRRSSRPDRCSDGTLVRDSSHAPTHHATAAAASVAALAMRIAVISDIHANLHALESVLADVDRESVDEIWCLGDVVGYGPRPNECCDLIRERAAISLCGNHDLASLGLLDVAEFSGDAATAARWTSGVLGDEQRAWLGSLAPLARRDGAELFHASPRDPVWEYVLSEEVALLSLEATTAAARARRPHPRRARAGAGRRRDRRRPRARRRRRSSSTSAASWSTPARSGSRATATRARPGYSSTPAPARQASGACPTRSNRRRRRCGMRASRDARWPSRSRSVARSSPAAARTAARSSSTQTAPR